MVIIYPKYSALCPSHHCYWLPLVIKTEEKSSAVMSDLASTWTSPETVLPRLPGNVVMLVQAEFVSCWQHIKRKNQLLSNFKSNRFLL